MVAELPDSSGPIIKPDFILDEIDVPRALNRIANIADAEQWEEWEIREAVRQVLVNGSYQEQRPSFYMGKFRRGLVIAAGDGSGVRFGDVVLFSFRLSAFWGSAWRDCPRIDSGNILFTDGSGAAVSVDSHKPIYTVPRGAAPGRFRIEQLENEQFENGMLERKLA